MPVIHLDKKISNVMKRQIMPSKGRWHPFQRMNVLIDPSINQYDRLRYSNTMFVFTDCTPDNLDVKEHSVVSLQVDDPLLMTKIAWEVHDALSPKST